MNASSKHFLISLSHLMTILLLLIFSIGCKDSITLTNTNSNIPKNIDSLYVMAKQTKNDSLINIALKSYIKSYYRKKDWKPFHQYRQEHLLLTARIGDTTSYARTLEYTASYFSKQNKTDSAYYYYTQSLKLYKATKDSLNIGFTLLNLAIIQKNLRNYPNSIHNLKGALVYMESRAKPRRISSIYNTLGGNYNHMKAYDTALVYHNKSKKIRETIKNPAYLVQSLNNIGKVYKDKGDYATALDYFNKALTYDEILVKYPNTKATLIDNQTHTLFLLGKKDRNIKRNLHNALSIRDSINDAYGKAVSYIHLAEYYQANNNKKKATDYIHLAGAIAKKNDNHQDYIDALELQVLFFDGEDKQRAMNSYKLIRDSLDFADKMKLKDLYDVEQELAKTENAITYHEDEIKKRKKNTIVLIAIAVIIVLLLLLIVIFINRRKKKKEKELEKSHKELLVVSDELDATKESLIQMAFRGKVDPKTEAFHKSLQENFNLEKRPALYEYLILRGAGKSNKEIAEIVNISLNGAKGRGKRLIKHLKNITGNSSEAKTFIMDFYHAELKKFQKQNRNNSL